MLDGNSILGAKLISLLWLPDIGQGIVPVQDFQFSLMKILNSTVMGWFSPPIFVYYGFQARHRSICNEQATQFILKLYVSHSNSLLNDQQLWENIELC